LITFDYNKNTGKLLFRCDNTTFDRVRDYFSVEDPNARFKRRMNRFIPTRKYAITPTGQCDLGLYWEIRKYLIENQITDTVDISDNLQKVLKTDDITAIYKEFTHELRDYQLEVIKEALKIGRGTCVLGTGAGKTLTTAAIIENYYRLAKNRDTFKCLVIVPDLGLVSQTFDEFNSSGISFKLTKWTGSNVPDLTSNVVICNIGILQSQFEDNEWIKYVDLLIVDECHKIRPDNKISKIISKIKSLNRFGFTGTLPEDRYDQWSIIGKLGPVIYEKTSYSLRLENYLTNVEVKCLNLQYNQQIPQVSDNKYRNELEFIHNNSFRNKFICNLCNKLPYNTLILVNHIAHGELLQEYFNSSSTDKQVYFIRGEVSVDDRDNIKRLMEKSDNVICIAISAIFSTGVNIKNLHNIVFAAGGKSFIRTVQSIGRGLRLHDNKEKLHIFDLCDELEYGTRHSEKRKQIYLKETIKYTDRYFKMC
jgi:superfamily II DNA or RNA helicase